MAESNNFALHLERYLKTLLQQGKSEHTVSAYRRDLSELMRLLPDNLENGLPTRRDFVVVLKKLSQKGLSESSLARKLSVWRQYCSWLVQIEVMESDPTFNMKAPRLPERLPDLSGVLGDSGMEAARFLALEELAAQMDVLALECVRSGQGEGYLEFLKEQAAAFLSLTLRRPRMNLTRADRAALPERVRQVISAGT